MVKKINNIKISWREERGRRVTSHLSRSPSPIFYSIFPTKISQIFFSQSNVFSCRFLFIFLSLILYLLIFISNQKYHKYQGKYKFATLAREEYFDQNK